MEVHLITEIMSSMENAEDSKFRTALNGLDEQFVAQLVSRAKAGVLALTGEGGVLAQLTERLLLTDVARSSSTCRDRDSSFDPKIVAKRQKRLGGVTKW